MFEEGSNDSDKVSGSTEPVVQQEAATTKGRGKKATRAVNTIKEEVTPVVPTETVEVEASVADSEPADQEKHVRDPFVSSLVTFDTKAETKLTTRGFNVHGLRKQFNTGLVYLLLRNGEEVGISDADEQDARSMIAEYGTSFELQGADDMFLIRGETVEAVILDSYNTILIFDNRKIYLKRSEYEKALKAMDA